MTETPITEWISGVQKGNDSFVQPLWNHYFQQVVRLARARMLALQGVIYDEEDAAASAMRSLIRGIKEDRFPQLDDRNNLWRILVLITRRKLRAQWRRESAARRVPTNGSRGDPITLEEIICTEPTPDFVAEMMDETESLLRRLEDRTLQRVLLMRLDGLTNEEIADQLGCATRTVQRKLVRLRMIWGVEDL